MPESIPDREPPTRAHTHIQAPDKVPQGPNTQPMCNHPTPRIRPENQGDQRTNEIPKKARLRANIRIMSQNVNGAAIPSENMSYREKWKSISNTIHTEKIAILAIQEAHLDQSMTEQLERAFEKNLKILISAPPKNP